MFLIYAKTHVHLTCTVQDDEIRSVSARHSPSESEYAGPRVFAQQQPGLVLTEWRQPARLEMLKSTSFIMGW